jgi:hypothetical protein
MRAREHRQKVLIQARMRAGGLPTDICIRDISSRGMLIQSGIAPPRGTYIEVITATETIVGRVIWGDDERFGISTRDKVHVAMVVGGRRSTATDDAPREAMRRAVSPARPTLALESAGSRMFEFAVLATFALAAVATLGSVAYQTLARPIEEVASRVRDG